MKSLLLREERTKWLLVEHNSKQKNRKVCFFHVQPFFQVQQFSSQFPSKNKRKGTRATEIGRTVVN